MNIGEVLQILEEEFPDVTVSKLRYLESRGLVRPERSPAGYRRYTDADVSRLTWVLRQQRDRFLPLKIIAEILEDGYMEDTEEGGSVSVPAFREQIVSPSSGSVSMSRSELARMVGLGEEVVGELERLGLIEGRSAGRTRVYDDEDVLVARVAACFLGHGLDARHLRGFLVSAKREAGLLEQLLHPLALERGKGEIAVSEVRRLVDELLDAGSALHELLIRRELRGLGR